MNRPASSVLRLPGRLGGWLAWKALERLLGEGTRMSDEAYASFLADVDEQGRILLGKE